MSRHYPTRCARIAAEMQHDNWPRLRHAAENGEYATLWRSELIWRLVWGKGSRCSDDVRGAYEGQGEQ